jgi:hypothetical protein
VFYGSSTKKRYCILWLFEKERILCSIADNWQVYHGAAERWGRTNAPLVRGISAAGTRGRNGIF